MKTFIASPVPLSINHDSDKNKFIAVGGNPGNMVFMNALEEQIIFDDIIDVHSKIDNPSEIMLVMPSSNYIRHINKNDLFFKEWVSFLEKYECKMTLVGLGAQSSKYFNTPEKLVKVLTKEQVRFLKIISERCTSIGVRGKFTAKCLELLRIKNYHIIGCPSIFKYTDGNFPKLEFKSYGNSQMTFTPKMKSRTSVLNFGYRNNSIWVKQSTNETPKYIKIFDRDFLSLIWLKKNCPGLKIGLRDLEEYSAKSMIFFDINQWNKFYNDQCITFSYGTRFHGNVESLRNGVPALWITHDSRTKELTEFLHLPHISIEEFKNYDSIEDLKCICDYSDFYLNYKSLCKNYISYLDENHIPHKFILSEES
mgnify:CR=1 FL=1